MAIKLINRRKGAAPDAPTFAPEDFDEPITAIGSAGAALLHLKDLPSGDVGGACDLGAQWRSFADILDSLRTEEDSFRFEIVSATRGHRRVVVDKAEMLIGWDETGGQVSCDAASVRAPRACVRKEWGAVFVRPHGPGTVEVNGEPVEASRRLRDGDRLTLLPTAVAAGPRETFLVFHEPAMLVALDSLLPQQWPPPVSPAPGAAGAEANQEPPASRAFEPVPAAGPCPVSPRQSYFGYFTFGEVAIMSIGTFVAAVLIFMLMAFM